MMGERVYELSCEGEWKLKEDVMGVKSRVSGGKLSNGGLVGKVMEKCMGWQGMRVVMGEW